MNAATGHVAHKRISPPRQPSTPKAFITAKNRGGFQRALLGWYDQNRRDLPWRRTNDPYRIWVSEIMLQQTRVAAVLDHYRIFLERFPTIQALADASENSVLAAWSGLGYYRRARMLHRCAKSIVGQHRGLFPQNSLDLITLPGIGRYTAAAVASIAFGEPVAVVDGNVERVLQRLMGKRLTQVETWHEAQAVLDRSRPGDFNQAMMELGSTVCIPREPRCRVCPVRRLCGTRGESRGAARVAIQKKKHVWCVLEWRCANGTNNNNDDNNDKNNRKVRLMRRPKNASLMPGMWELPQSSEPPLSLPTVPVWRTFRHSITVTDYTVHVLRNPPVGKNTLAADFNGKSEWISVERIAQTPITGLTKKILKADGII